MATQDQVIGADRAAEEEESRSLAQRYHYDFVDLTQVAIDAELFRSVPVELMFRYNFVPVAEDGGGLRIAIADPRQLATLDEISLLLGKKIRIHPYTPICSIIHLKKSTFCNQLLFC